MERGQTLKLNIERGGRIIERLSVNHQMIRWITLLLEKMELQHSRYKRIIINVIGVPSQ